jgi:NAD(P)-dependent dehydrogenase (short-subunit alcohol dehydrogenase family)
MDLQLKSKIALVTGGSKGIGFACALLLRNEGARVAIVSRSGDSLIRASARMHDDVLCLAADLRNESEAIRVVEQCEEALGPIDVLVNCAGAAGRCSPFDLRPARWRDAIDAKFFSYINVIDPVISRMAKRRGGVIVNVIGTGGKRASPSHLAGGSANAALMLATVGLASAYGPMGVRVVGLNPGMVATDRVGEDLAVDAALGGKELEALHAERIGAIPLRRLGEPAEVAAAVAFLASPISAYMSGANITMDGALGAFVV